jgi:predicted RNA-binding protein YlxR (DUF448 family)
VVYDDTGKLSGRGAYVCADAACIRLAEKKRILDRHLGQAVAPDVYAVLYAEAAARASSDGPPPQGT